MQEEILRGDGYVYGLNGDGFMGIHEFGISKLIDLYTLTMYTNFIIYQTSIKCFFLKYMGMKEMA